MLEWYNNNNNNNNNIKYLIVIQSIPCKGKYIFPALHKNASMIKYKNGSFKLVKAST